MSRPLSRITVAALIVLVLAVAVFATVQAASSSGSIKARADLTASDSYYASQQRGASQKLSPYSTDNFKEGKEGGGCEREGFNSNDY